MKIDINEKDITPIYRQIMNGIIEKVATGFLHEEGQAPSVREIAINSHVNPNTVARAYQELINTQILFVKRGIGNFVSKGGKNICKNKIIENTKYGIKKEIERLRNLGFSKEDINKLIKDIRSEK
ncbi:GntR family transcriptional regulator [bacterium]|nr:GntR family transcriptional regulator [bacterium]